MVASGVKKLRFQLHRASNLPESRIGSREYFATVTTSTGWRGETDKLRESSPEWNKTFVCEVSESNPNLSIEIFRLHKFSNKAPELVAKVSVNAASCLTSSSVKIFERRCRLESPNSAQLKKANIYYSCTQDHNGVTTENQNLDLTALLNVVEEERYSSKLTTPAVAGSITALSDSSDVLPNIVGILSKINQIGDAVTEVHPYAKLVWSVLSSAQKIIIAQVIRDDNVRELWDTVSEALDLARQAEELRNRPMYKKKVEELLQQIYECVLFLRWYEGKGFGSRVVRDSSSTKSEDAIARFNRAFRDLSNSFRDRLSLGQVMQTYRLVDLAQLAIDIGTHDFLSHVVRHLMWSATARDQRLDELPGAKLSSVEYDPNRACLPGTRIKLLDDIYAWIHSLNDGENKRILWLSGPAGTGKSSVANSVAARMDSLGRLAASFRFDRNVAARTPDVLMGNICRQVARFNGSLQNSVFAAIHRYGPGGTMACTSQAKKLLVEPIRNTELVGPIVFVIDALDESGRDDVSTGSTSRMDLVRTITRDLIDLPPSVKLLVTSREEGCVPGLMSACTSCKHVQITSAESTEEDIKRYIESRMVQIRAIWNRPVSWPGEDQIHALVRYADGLFICAAVACTFIEENQPNWRLKTILDSSMRTEAQAEKKLDDLYRTVFLQSLRGSNLEITFHRLVLGTIVALKMPLTVASMDALLSPTEQTTGDIVSSLKPVMMIDAEMKQEVRLLHTSVFDFLTVRAEDDIRVDITSQNKKLAIHCLMYMNQNLHYNMKWVSAGLHSFPSSDLGDTSVKTALCDSLALRYACLHFAEHLADSEPCNQMLATYEQSLGKFLTEHLLHWLEFMARLKKVHVVGVSLRKLISWLEDVGDGSKSNSWLSILSDAMVFLQTFHMVATLSPMDIYHSALPMSPQTSTLYKIYYSCTPCLPTVMSSHPLWTRSLQVFEGHSGYVTSVVFSSDGKKLASGSWDSTVQLWDAENGEAIGLALEGHTRPVISVVFSNDGKKLASGSWDKTVQLWDVEKGEAIGPALRGHTREVTSVVFSSDGTKLASGSNDNTVWLWDAEKGEAVKPALKGHTSFVTSVVFSSDGKKLASGSWDNTVRLWDVEKGKAIGPALEGHTNFVTSVVFSNDGEKLASGSWDGTVQLWDTEKGKAIGPALEGHTGGVASVIFSNDGKKLASGSDDTTVQLWDVEKGVVIGPALEGHTGGVSSVVFSSDGKKLASGSTDNTVRLWDVEKGEAIGPALEGHTKFVTSVAFSSDNKKLASGSWDNTVRLWNAEGGKATGPSLEEYTTSVISIVFSNDGRKLACGSNDNTVQLWDAEKGEVIGPPLKGHTGAVISVVFSSDGKKLASGSENGTVWLWDAEKGKAIGPALEGHADAVTSVVFSNDGKRLASGSWDGTVQLWDTEKGKAIGPALEGHAGIVHLLEFSSDGKKLASGSLDNTLQVWDVEKGAATGSALDGHEGVASILPSCDGKKLASRSWDNRLWLWDVEKSEGYELNMSDDIDIILSNFPDSWLVASYPTNDPGNVEISRTLTPKGGLKFDEAGFITNNDHSHLIWIPAHLRGSAIAVHEFTHSIAIGGYIGPLTIIRNLKRPYNI